MTEDLDKLIWAYLDGDANRDQVEQLETILRDDAAARTEFFRAASLDYELTRVFAVRLSEESPSAEGAATNVWIAGDHSLAPTHGVLEMPRPGRSRRRRVFLWGSAAAAAGLVITLGVWRFALPHGVGSDDTTGTVVEMRGTVNMERTAIRAREGDALRVGDGMVVGDDGLCRFRYADGSVIVVHSNSVFRLIEGVTPSAKSVFLEKGMLMADARKQRDDARMTFKTPHASATIVGTQLSLTAGDMGTALNVISGAVEFAGAGKREMVASGESATVRDGVLLKFTAKGVAGATTAIREDGQVLFRDSFGNGLTNWMLYTRRGNGGTRPTTEEDCPDIRIVRSDRDGASIATAAIREDGQVLFRDSFGNGLTNWMLYTRRGNGGTRPTTEEDCPDIRIVRADRDGASISAVELVGRAPDGTRVGIVTKPIEARTDAYSLSYEYTFDDRPRNAMEGLEIHMGREFPQKALGPGLWNKVRWECVRKRDARGKPYLDASLFFNGELIGRTEYALTGEGIDLVLEVVEGRFRFANVEIREMPKARGD